MDLTRCLEWSIAHDMTIEVRPMALDGVLFVARADGLMVTEFALEHDAALGLEGVFLWLVWRLASRVGRREAARSGPATAAQPQAHRAARADAIRGS